MKKKAKKGKTAKKVKTVRPKKANPQPVTESLLPKMDLRVGTIVESVHHGRGVVRELTGYGAQIIFDPLERDGKKIHSGGFFHYWEDGRFFAEDSDFCEAEPVLAIIEQPAPVEQPVPEPAKDNEAQGGVSIH